MKRRGVGFQAGHTILFPWPVFEPPLEGIENTFRVLIHILIFNERDGSVKGGNRVACNPKRPNSGDTILNPPLKNSIDVNKLSVYTPNTRYACSLFAQWCSIKD